MSNPLGINFGLLDQFSLQTHSYSSYFFPAAVRELDYCTLPANADSDVAFATDQSLIDSLGNLLDLESEKLNKISTYFSTLEDTLSLFYGQRPGSIYPTVLRPNQPVISNPALATPPLNNDTGNGSEP